MLQHRRERKNAKNDYRRFYPVVYTDTPNTNPFGPLYTECEGDEGGSQTCTEPKFNKKTALLENSGLNKDLLEMCETFASTGELRLTDAELRQKFCLGT